MLLRLQRAALARVLTGSATRGWVVLGTTVWLLRTAKRLLSPEPETVYSATLKPGETIQIDHLALDQAGRPVRNRAKKKRRRR